MKIVFCRLDQARNRIYVCCRSSNLVPSNRPRTSTIVKSIQTKSLLPQNNQNSNPISIQQNLFKLPSLSECGRVPVETKLTAVRIVGGNPIDVILEL